MNLTKTKTITSLIVLALVGCGGGGGDSSSDDDQGSSTPPPVTPDTTISVSMIDVGMKDQGSLVIDIESKDLNGDGLNDLIFSRISESYSTGSRLQALINNGDKTFTDATDTYFGEVNGWGDQEITDSSISGDRAWVESLKFVDINGDGIADIIPFHDSFNADTLDHLENPNLLNSTYRYLVPLLGKTDGSYTRMNFNDLPTIGAMLPIDIDNDGDVDLVMNRSTAWDEDSYTWSKNLEWVVLENMLADSGTFSFNATVKKVNFTATASHPSFIYTPITIDVNQDGYQDIVYSGPRYNGAWVNEVADMVVLINDTKGNFDEQSDLHLANVSGFIHTREMVKADLNGDQTAEIIIATQGYDAGSFDGEPNGILSVSNNQLNGEVIDQTALSYKGFSHSIDAADIDNDGDIDIVISDITGAEVENAQLIRILRNDGTGKFTTEFIPFTIEDGSLPYVVSSKFVDLNQDGFVDLVLGGDHRKHNLGIVWNDGEGNFF